MNSTLSQWVRSGVNLPFSGASTSCLWPTFSEMDNNSRENIVELRTSRTILLGRPGCGYAYSSSKSPGTITHITWGRGWFLSGFFCLNNTSIVIFAILWADRLIARVRIFQGFQNLFFISFMAFRKNSYMGTVHFCSTPMLKTFGSFRVKSKLYMNKKTWMMALKSVAVTMDQLWAGHGWLMEKKENLGILQRTCSCI